MSPVRPLILLLVILSAAAGGACHEEGDVEIASLDFIGVEGVVKDALADALQTRQGSRLWWGRRRFFDRKAFDTDVKRIEAFYRDRGFPDARVTSFDIQFNDAQDKVALTLTISEGEPIVVSSIELAGFDVLSEDDRQALQRALPLQAEQPLDRQLAVTARERALNELRDHGYPYAAVTVTELNSSPRTRRVVLEAVPGKLAYFGEIEINGLVSVSENVIRRQLTFQPGEVFTRSAMRDSQRKIYGLELFEFVNVESREDMTVQSPDVPVRITVTESEHRKVNFGVGYGSEEHARGWIRWDHFNIFGGGRQAGAEGKWSSLDRGVRLDYTEPFIVSNHWSLNFEGRAWQAVEPLYSLDSLGGRVTLRHRADLQNFWSVTLINEYQRSTVEPEALLDPTLHDELIALGLDPRTGEVAGTLSAVAIDLGRSTTNNLLDASTGYVLNGHVEQAGDWLMGSWNYWAVMVEARHFATVGRRFVIANRLRAGTIDSAGDVEVEVPFYKRYFLGGAYSIRGWGRFEVGPITELGLSVGGNTMLEGSFEVRAPLPGKFGAVAFVDFGNVWSQPWDFRPGDLRYAVGPGLRYMTPVGPARFDFGYQLNPIDGLRVNGTTDLRPWRIHFSLGQAF